jgi:hypothetical protein
VEKQDVISIVMYCEPMTRIDKKNFLMTRYKRAEKKRHLPLFPLIFSPQDLINRHFGGSVSSPPFNQ